MVYLLKKQIYGREDQILTVTKSSKISLLDRAVQLQKNISDKNMFIER